MALVGRFPPVDCRGWFARFFVDVYNHAVAGGGDVAVDPIKDAAGARLGQLATTS
jgi:hypothetical protein